MKHRKLFLLKCLRGLRKLHIFIFAGFSISKCQYRQPYSIQYSLFVMRRSWPNAARPQKPHAECRDRRQPGVKGRVEGRGPASNTSLSWGQHQRQRLCRLNRFSILYISGMYTLLGCFVFTYLMLKLIMKLTTIFVLSSLHVH